MRSHSIVGKPHFYCLFLTNLLTLLRSGKIVLSDEENERGPARKEYMPVIHRISAVQRSHANLNVY